MTRDEIERLAVITGIGQMNLVDGRSFFSIEKMPTLENLNRLADAVSRTERDACAEVAESRIDPEWPGDDLSSQAASIADAIRARDNP